MGLEFTDESKDAVYMSKYTLTTPKLLIIFFSYFYFKEARCWWCSWLRHCATSRKVSSSILDGVTGILKLTYSFRLHYGLGVDSTSNRNEYQEYFLGVKAVGAYG
jgi:hypothetical protein